MKIELTKEQYLTLARSLYMSSFIANFHKSEEDPLDTTYFETMQHLLKHAQEFDAVKECSTNNGVLNLTDEDCGEMHVFLEEFIETSFWNELIERLADRDTGRTKEFGNKPPSDPKRAAFFERQAESYADIFEKVGLDSIDVKGV